jgi:hypothetical protein
MSAGSDTGSVTGGRSSVVAVAEGDGVALCEVGGLAEGAGAAEEVLEDGDGVGVVVTSSLDDVEQPASSSAVAIVDAATADDRIPRPISRVSDGTVDSAARPPEPASGAAA